MRDSAPKKRVSGTPRGSVGVRVRWREQWLPGMDGGRQQDWEPKIRFELQSKKTTAILHNAVANPPNGHNYNSSKDDIYPAKSASTPPLFPVSLARVSRLCRLGLPGTSTDPHSAQLHRGSAQLRLRVGGLAWPQRLRGGRP